MARELWPVIALPAVVAALVASLAFRREVGEVREPSVTAAAARHVPPAPAAQRADVVAEPAAGRESGALVARVAADARVAVRSSPRGRVETVVGSQTEFGSPRVLGVVRRRGRWLGVTLPELRNGRLGWVDSRAARVRVSPAPVSLVIDLSARRLVLRRGGRVLRSTTVSVGSAGSPTPTGRFAVTDKLAGARFSTVYGCCILALSGRQPRLPPGWTGGDRLAVHGAPEGKPIGSASTAGCLHATERELRALMRDVPLGTPVAIRD